MSAALCWSSESYEVAFPILSFCLNVPILGQDVTFLKREERKEGRKSWSFPKHLGMECDKVYTEGLIRGVFCFFTCGEKGTRGEVNKQKVDRDSSHLATLCCDLMRKSNDTNTHNTQTQTPAT